MHMDVIRETLYPSHHFLFPLRGCSSVDRVLASEAKGRRFDSYQPRQEIKDLQYLLLSLGRKF
jgi:hypothetical protein